MPPSGITKKEVLAAAFRLLRRGETPSTPKVREELGNRGSNSTIQRLLEEWREGLDEDQLEILPPSVPRELEAHVEAFWNACSQLAMESFAQDRQDFREHMSKAEERIQAANAEAARWQEYSVDRESQVEVMKNDLEQSLRRTQELKAEVDRLERSLSDVTLQQRDADRRHESAVANLKEKNAIALREWESRRSELETKLAQAEERIKYEIQRGEGQSDHWMNQLVNERESSQRALELARQIRGRVESELTITRKREEHAIARAERLERDKEALQTKLEAESKDAEGELEQIRFRHEEQLKSITDELNQVRSQQNDLRTQLGEAQADISAKSELISALRELKGGGSSEEPGKS